MLKKLVLFAFLLSFGLMACQQKSTEITYPTLPSTLKVGVPLALEVRTGAENLEFKWWTKYEKEDWVIIKNWSSDKTFSFVPDKPGIYAIQVDVKEKKKETELEKKWLGQIQVSR